MTVTKPNAIAREIAFRGVMALATTLLALAQGIGEKAPSADKDSIPFTRVTIDQTPPDRPWYKMLGDINGDGFLDIVVAGASGFMVWYKHPGWKRTEITLKGWDGVNGEIGDMDRDGDNDIVMGGVVWFSNPGSGVGRWTRNPRGWAFASCGGKWKGCCSSFANRTGQRGVRSRRAEYLRVSHGPRLQVRSPIIFCKPFITITDQPGRNMTPCVWSNAHWKSTQPDARKGPLS